MTPIELIAMSPKTDDGKLLISPEDILEVFKTAYAVGGYDATERAISLAVSYDCWRLADKIRADRQEMLVDKASGPVLLFDEDEGKKVEYLNSLIQADAKERAQLKISAARLMVRVEEYAREQIHLNYLLNKEREINAAYRAELKRVEAEEKLREIGDTEDGE